MAIRPRLAPGNLDWGSTPSCSNRVGCSDATTMCEIWQREGLVRARSRPWDPTRMRMLQVSGIGPRPFRIVFVLPVATMLRLGFRRADAASAVEGSHSEDAGCRLPHARSRDVERRPIGAETMGSRRTLCVDAVVELSRRRTAISASAIRRSRCKYFTRDFITPLCRRPLAYAG